MSRKGDCWDNACAETFFASLESELIGDRIIITREQARREIFEYIEVFYNRRRLHSNSAYLTPHEFKRICGRSGMMSSERRRPEKRTRVAGHRANSREGLVLGHPPKQVLSDR